MNKLPIDTLLEIIKRLPKNSEDGSRVRFHLDLEPKHILDFSNDSPTTAIEEIEFYQFRGRWYVGSITSGGNFMNF